MNVLILANPFSGSRPNRKIVGRLESALQARGVSVTTVWSVAERLAALKAIEDDETVVVAAGGDGSIADVVNDMDAAGRLGLRFATLPVGNENLFAQEFGFSRAAEPMASAIAKGQTRAIDLVRICSARDAGERPRVDRLFALMASAGFDAQVIHSLDRWRKGLTEGELRRVNRRSYVKRIIEVVRSYRYPAVTLVADGREFAGHQAYVFNLNRYGGGLEFAPDARGDDRELDWVVFERPGFWRLVGYHLRVICGGHSRGKTVATGRANRVSLRSAGAEGVPAQADGDPAGHSPLDLAVVPGALRVIRI